MKIAFFMAHDTKYYKLGSEIYAENLAKELSKIGNEIHIFRGFSKEDNVVKLNNMYINNLHSKNIPFLGSYFTLKKSLKMFHKAEYSGKFDWIITIGAGVAFISKRLRKRKLAFFISEITMDEYKEIKSFRIKIKKALFYYLLNIGEKRGIKYSKIILCNTKYQINKLNNIYNNISNKLIYNPSGLSEEWFADENMTYGSKFIFVGAGERRNVELFIKALIILNEKGYNVSGVVVREDEYKIKKLIEGYNVIIEIYNNIDVKDLMQKYRESVALIMPTYKEAFCLPIVEAGSQWVPTIASALPEFAELIENEKSGILINNFEVNTWVKWMEKLLNDREYLKNMKIEARKKAENFKLSKIANNLNKILEDRC